MENIKLFSGTKSIDLAQKVADFYGYPLSEWELKTFNDGEMQPVITESVRGARVFIIQSTFAPAENLLELMLLIDSCKRASVKYITAVIPYFGYARQDRKDKPRVPISAKMIANILQTAGADRVMTMDLHADQIQGFFDIPVDHIRAEAIFVPFLKKFVQDNTIFASPDVGGVKRARTYAKFFNRELVICDKEREIANQVKTITVIGEVKDADVILVDDIIDTAGTLCMAADALITKGAKSVRAMCTHAVLSGNALERIEKSKLTELIVTDTIPLKKTSKKIKVLTTSQLFAKAIRNTHEYRSIAALFID